MDIFEEQINIRIDLSKEKLKSKAEMLRNMMDVLIKRIESNNLRSINSLGEVQGLGDSIDVYCMELRTLVDTIEEYKALEKLK